MTETVTVYHNENPLILHREVARALSHAPGKNLTEAETWEAIRLNARVGIQKCEAAIAEIEADD